VERAHEVDRSQEPRARRDRMSSGEIHSKPAAQLQKGAWQCNSA
jgi:hypothetical protein